MFFSSFATIDMSNNGSGIDVGDKLRYHNADFVKCPVYKSKLAASINFIPAAVDYISSGYTVTVKKVINGNVIQKM